MSQMGFGYAQTQVMGTDEWLTPPGIIHALGQFDLDPCAPIIRPWPTATKYYTIEDNGLIQKWEGRVWLNPPYGDEVWKWMDRMAEHKNGIALIFARTGVPEFHRTVWNKAHSLLFIKGRLHFHYVSGARAAHNSGADSVFVSYCEAETEVLRTCKIKGKLIVL